MRIGLILVLLFSATMATEAAPPANASSPNWRKIVAERLPQFGHRNWIVVADSAYPDQSRPGIETVVVNADQMTVVRGVMEILSHSKHVTPIVNLDSELQFLDEKDAPGIEVYRQQLDALLQSHPLQRLPHESIINKLDQVSQTFRVLILKTNMTLPYTSVFLQLDCAYWGPEAEKRLREKMK